MLIKGRQLNDGSLDVSCADIELGCPCRFKQNLRIERRGLDYESEKTPCNASLLRDESSNPLVEKAREIRCSYERVIAEAPGCPNASREAIAEITFI